MSVKIEFTQEQFEEVLRYMDLVHSETIQDAVIQAIRKAEEIENES